MEGLVNNYWHNSLGERAIALFFMPTYFVYLSLFLLLACSESDTKIHKGPGDSPHAKASATGVTGKPLDAASGCYRMGNTRGSAFLTLVIMDSAVSGTLEYHLYEKDRNKGAIKGIRRGNLIFADYSFASEGVTSVREVVFKLEEGKLIEGYGEGRQIAGKMSFKDPAKLKFDSGIVFHKLPCNR